MSDAIRVVVGEPDYLAREGLVRALEAMEGITVVSICSRLDALRAAATHESPHVVVTALRFPAAHEAETVIDLVDDLQGSHPEIGVLVLGERGDAGDVLRLFDRRLERFGFVLRERIQNSAELTRAITEIARGRSLVDPGAVGTFLAEARGSVQPSFSDLTTRERDVLRLVAEAESNIAIARDLGITTRAVERHVNSIFKKLGLNGSRDVNRRVKAALTYAFAGNRPAGSSH
jgi:DNA-binding NarL/FixJ family response regulator